MKQKLLGVLKAIGIWIWCFPQQLAGLIVRLCTKAEKRGGGYYVYNVKSGSLSLGTFIFLSPEHDGNERILRHEMGHTKQSYILGWLFLLVIGLPSVIWASCFKTYRVVHGIDYYSFYTEKWADELGGVENEL